VIDVWTIVRFLHILGASVWMGGQLTITLVVLPPARRALSATEAADVLAAVGRRFAVITAAVFLPVQITTGVLLAGRRGVTWSSLLQPENGYDRTLAAKLLLFALVMAAAGVHGIAQGKQRPTVARAASITALIGSVGVVLLATGLVEGGMG
jgi:uncharacterized membrane protein